MYCPKCGAENKDTYKSCWNCFAQLHAVENVISGKPDKAKKPVPGPDKATLPEPAAELPVPMAAVAELPVVDLPKEEIVNEPLNESSFVIPGLAEPQPVQATAFIPEPMTFKINDPAGEPEGPNPPPVADPEPVSSLTVAEKPFVLEPAEKGEPRINFEAEEFDLSSTSDTESESELFIPGLGFLPSGEEEADSGLQFGEPKAFDLSSCGEELNDEEKDEPGK